MKKKIFKREESPYMPGKWVIQVDHEGFYLLHTVGSFQLIQARLMGLDYADYLRMCRDHYGAEIIGKNSKYPVAYFERSKKMDDLIDILNARANVILWNREHPDFEKHAEVVAKEDPEFYKEVTSQ